MGGINKPVFSVDWEPWFCLYPYGKIWEENDPLVDEPTLYLLDLLRRHNIKAVWYVLGWLGFEKKSALQRGIEDAGHVIGYHSHYHTYEDWSKHLLSDPLFRAPRFKGQKRLHGGGFFLRALPYWLLKKIVLKEGVFYIHPHDLLWEHPKLYNPWHNFKRQIGLKTVRDKLERLTREVEFADATHVYKSAQPRQEVLLQRHKSERADK